MNRQLTEKTEEAITYILSLTNSSPEKLGKTKLNKILWFFEAICFLKYGYYPLNETYIKHYYGPVMKNLDSYLEKLKKKRKIQESMKAHRSLPGYTWIYNLVEPCTTKNLTSEELKLLSQIVFQIIKRKARDISDKTHRGIFKWKPYGEEIKPSAIVTFFWEKHEKIKQYKNYIEETRKVINAIEHNLPHPTVIKLQKKLNELYNHRI